MLMYSNVESHSKQSKMKSLLHQLENALDRMDRLG